MRDRQLEIAGLFEDRARALALSCLSDEVVAEHATNPAGPHSDPLQRVLRYFRRAPVAGKLVIIVVRPWEEYRLGALTGAHGEAPVVLDDGPFGSESEAMHAVFLRRVAELRGSEVS